MERTFAPAPARRVVVIAVVLAFAVGALVLLGFLAGSAERVIVPNVEGMPVSAAARSLDSYGISIDGEGIDAVVVEQDPIGGERWWWYKPFTLTYEDESGTHTIQGHGSPWS